MSPGAYRLDAKKIRGSIVAAIAYAAGLRMRDERTLKLYNFAARSGDREEVLDTIQFSPSVLNETLESFWNRVTRQNTHHFPVYGRRLVKSLPKELSRKGMWWVGRAFARYLSRKYRVAVFTAFHGPRRKGAKKHPLEDVAEIAVSNGNWHLHTYLSYCVVNRDGSLGLKQVLLDPISCSNRGTLNFCDVERAVWAECVNRQLAREGVEERVDHRSNEARGIPDKPTKHLGPHLAALERQGISTDLGHTNRVIRQTNARNRRTRPHHENLRAIVDVLSAAPEHLDSIRPRRMGQWLAKAFHRGRRDDVRAFSRSQKIILMKDGGAITVNDDAVVVLQWGSNRQARKLLDAIQAEIAHDESMAFSASRWRGHPRQLGEPPTTVKRRPGALPADVLSLPSSRTFQPIERLIPRFDVPSTKTTDTRDDEGGSKHQSAEGDADAPDEL